MANEKVVFKRGTTANLPTTKTPGTVLLDVSTGAMYVDDTSSSRVQVKDTTKLGKSENAVSASKLATARNINGMSFNGEANRVNYGSCSTSAATAAKTVACTGFALVTGAEITVKFTVTNTASSPTLNVNSTGAKPIYYNGSAISAGHLAANRTYTFRYNGTQWDLVGAVVYTHPTTAGNKHIPSGGSSGQILRWSASGTAVWGDDNNTDVNVKQYTTNATNYRPLVFGYTNSSDPDELIKEDGSSVTGQVYVTNKIYSKPATGELFSSGLSLLTDSAHGSLKQATTDDNVTHTFPSVSGTVLNSGNYLNYKGHLRQTVMNQSSSTPTSTPWFKVASAILTTTSAHLFLTLAVSSGMVGNQAGILHVKVATGSTVGTNMSATAKWLNPTGIELEDFVLTYTETANTSVKYELWCKLTNQWRTYIFSVINEGTRTTADIRWELSGDTSSGSATYGTPTGVVESSYISNDSPSKMTENTADSEQYIFFNDSTTDGTLGYDPVFTYNPSKNTVTATKFVGALDGNAKTATTASKLSNTSAIGSATNPVYFNASGVPVKTTYTLGKSVPSDAVFTDINVKQHTTNATNYRPLVFGYTNSSDPDELIKEDGSSVTGQVYVTNQIYAKPATGELYAIKYNGSGSGLTNLNASNIASGTLSSDRLPTIPYTKGGTGATSYLGAQYNILNSMSTSIPSDIEDSTEFIFKLATTSSSNGFACSRKATAVWTYIKSKADVVYATKEHGDHVEFSTTAPKANGTAAVGTATTVSRSDHVHPLQTSVSGNAGTATKLKTAVKIDGFSFDGSASINHYATCSTAAATVAKVATINTGTFTLATGATVYVKFTNANTATSATLNVNSTGAKPIFHNGAAISASSYIKAGGVYQFVYDGTNWVINAGVDTNTVYTHPATAGNKHIPSGGSSGQILKWSSDGTATWATEYSYTHPTTAGNKHIPSGGSSGQILRWSAAGTAVWGDDNNTDINVMQHTTNAANYRPLVLGYTNSSDPDELIKDDGSSVTGQVYVTNTIYSKPSTGELFATKFNGSGAGLTSLNASNLSSGTVPLARIPTGTSSTTVALGNHTHSNYYSSSTSRTANTVLAAPNGSDGTASFRKLVAADLPTSGVTAASYGPSANATPTHGGTFSVPYVTVDKYGRVTAASTKTITLPADNNTDVNVKQVPTSASNYRSLVLGYTNNADASQLVGEDSVTNQVYVNNSLYAKASTGELFATKFNGAFAGSGEELTDINANNITSGTLNAARLATSGATAGSYGPSSNTTPAHGGTFNVPYFTIDNKGRVTAASTKTITLPASGNTDTKVNVTLATTTKAYLLATSTTPTSTATAVTALSDTGVYLDTTAGKLTATSFAGSGASLTSLNASNISSGTLSSDRLPTVPITKGGTGGTTANAAAFNLIGDPVISETAIADTTKLAFYYATPSTSNGALYAKPASTLWTYIEPKIEAAYQPLKKKTVTLPATAGWYRIASSWEGINRCHGIFTIEGTVSGRHTTATFTAQTSYGNANSTSITVLTASHYGNSAITKVRIVYHTTYSGNYAYLEVYNAAASATKVTTNIDSSIGWELIDVVAGSIPSGYSNKEVTLSNNTMVATTFSGTASKVTSAMAAPTSTTDSTAYAIAIHSGNTAGSKSLLNNAGIRCGIKSGTTTVGGLAYLYLGNNKATGTTGNQCGGILMYSDTTAGGYITAPGLSERRDYTLPDASGTIALTSDANKVLQTDLACTTQNNSGLRLPLLLGSKNTNPNNGFDDDPREITATTTTSGVNMTGLAWLETSYWTTGGDVGKAFARICASSFKVVGSGGSFEGTATKAVKLSYEPTINGVKFVGDSNITLSDEIWGDGTGFEAIIDSTTPVSGYDLLWVETNWGHHMVSAALNQHNYRTYATTPYPSSGGTSNSVIGTIDIFVVSDTSVKATVSNVQIHGSNTTISATKSTLTATIYRIIGIRLM